MADTKQATAEAVCEHCGAVESAHSWVMQWCSSGVNDRRRFTPRTQPIQELRIPDDLTEEYANAKAKGWQRRVELIERIARLEGAGR